MTTTNNAAPSTRSEAGPEQDADALVGTVLIQFYPDHDVLSVGAADSAAETRVQKRLDEWAIGRAGRERLRLDTTRIPTGAVPPRSGGHEQ